MSDYQLLQKLQSEARQKYARVVPAFAYVFQHNNENGLRLEAPDIVLEFSNGVPLGRDPRGLFYYYELSDLDVNLTMRYEIAIEKRFEDGAQREEVLVLNFWTKDDAPGAEPYAKFIAGIPFRAWGKTKPGKVVGGKWEPLNVLQATSVANSRGNQALVTLGLSSLKKRFEFNIPDKDVQGSAIDCHGSLVARENAQLAGSNLFVDYTNTRILIFKSQGDKYPIAVFSPLELPKDTALVNKTFQVQNGKFIDT
jgi:hypothetical protein